MPDGSASLPLSRFDYQLPAGRIAQSPAPERDASRLLHMTPDGTLEDRVFDELPSLLGPGDLLVVNDTTVRRARLVGERPGGARAEVLVLHALGAGDYACLVRPGRRLPRGAQLTFGASLRATIIDEHHDGQRTVRFECAIRRHVQQARSIPFRCRRLCDAPGGQLVVEPAQRQ